MNHLKNSNKGNQVSFLKNISGEFFLVDAPIQTDGITNQAYNFIDFLSYPKISGTKMTSAYNFMSKFLMYLYFDTLKVNQNKFV